MENITSKESDQLFFIAANDTLAVPLSRVRIRRYLARYANVIVKLGQEVV